MPFFKTDDLQLWTGGSWKNLSTPKPDIRGFSTDSREMSKDFAFVALKGHRDGCEFAADAVKNGATAVIADRELDVGVPVLVVKDALKAFQRIAKFHRLRFENPVVGITGSCGKTSTKHMLARLLDWKNPLVTEKNFNNEIGVPLTLTRIDMRQNQMAIVEAGVGAPGQMEELADMIEPDIAIITNVGLTHLEGFKEISAVAREKARMGEHVSANGWCVMHQNLLSWKAFDELTCKKAILAAAEAPEVKADLVFRYSISPAENSAYGIDMYVEGGDEYYFEAPDMSRGMVENLLLAIATALMLGAKEEQIQSRIETIRPLPMRGSVVETPRAKYYIDCYNASPTSMRDALAHFAKISSDSPKKLYVLGSMAELGLATHRHHKEIGSNIPADPLSRAILVGANAEIYKAGMTEKGWAEENIEVYPTAQEARESLEKFEGGFVFVKGSRICELEKALPEDVAKTMEKPAEIPMQKEEEEPEEIQENPDDGASEAADGDEEEDFQEEEFDQEIISRESEDERDL